MRVSLRYGGALAAVASVALALPSASLASGGPSFISGGAGLPSLADLAAAATTGGGAPSPGPGGTSPTGGGAPSPGPGGAPSPTGGGAPNPAPGGPPGPGPTSQPAPVAPPPGARARGRWIAGFTITEYWPAPEAWFSGRLVSAPGLPGKHRIDWLYSAEGISMNGEGIGLDGRMYHLAALGPGGWVTAAGRPTNAAKGWNGGPPFWRSGGYWRNRTGAVTFPLQTGGWSDGTGLRYVPLKGVDFASGPSLPVRPYQSIAVDPRLIPFGSLVYIPAYRNDGHGGWFVAQDTGGAIVGHRIDVYRTPPPSPAEGGQYLTGQRVFVAAPAHAG